jgi:hypothetical protein
MTTLMYTTVAALRGYLDQVDVSTATDEVLADIIIRATDIIRSAVRNGLRDETFDFTDSTPAATARSLNAGYGPYFVLPPHVVGTVTTVLDSEGATVSSSDYDEIQHSPDYGDLLLSGDPWSTTAPALWAGRYTVTASWGYGPVPPAFAHLTKEISADIWRKKDAGFFPEVGVAGEGAIPVVTEWDRLGVISAYVERYRREDRYE